MPERLCFSRTVRAAKFVVRKSWIVTGSVSNLSLSSLGQPEIQPLQCVP